MTHKEKLAEIENDHRFNTHKLPHPDCGRCYLLTRVRKLTEALEIYAQETEFITLGRLMTRDRGAIARKALEGES